MDALFAEIVKQSPILGVTVLFWWYTRKDFSAFVQQVQAENALREKSYQDTIRNLSQDLKADVKQIKDHLFKDGD